MAVKIRLRRIGAKKSPYYRVVVADSRSPRDGRFIEDIGYYNPLANPADIKIDPEKAKKMDGKRCTAHRDRQVAVQENGYCPVTRAGSITMADLKATLYDLARAIVDSPDDVTVAVDSETLDSINFVLSVSADDMGMVIGRHGRIARAIRTVMKAAGNTCGKRVNVEIR